MEFQLAHETSKICVRSCLTYNIKENVIVTGLSLLPESGDACGMRTHARLGRSTCGGGEDRAGLVGRNRIAER